MIVCSETWLQYTNLTNLLLLSQNNLIPIFFPHDYLMHCPLKTFLALKNFLPKMHENFTVQHYFTHLACFCNLIFFKCTVPKQNPQFKFYTRGRAS